MAEADRLTSRSSRDPVVDGSDRPAPDLERSMHRATVYWAVAGVLVAGTLLLRGSGPLATGDLHLVVETASTVLATVVGALALVRYHSKGRRPHLFVGIGFVGAAVLEMQHLAIGAGIGPTGVAGGEALAWSWFASMGFLALFLLCSRVGGVREPGGEGDDLAGSSGDGGARPRIRTGAAYAAGAAGAAAALVGLATAPLPDPYASGAALPRPWELVPGLVYLAALALTVRRGAWRRDAFEHWLVVALLLYAGVHLAYTSFSTAPGDVGDTVGHLVKVAAHGAVFVGLVTSVFVTTRREVRAVDEIRSANEALADEVSTRRRAERVLQESEERVQDFLDNANDLIQSTTPDGTLLYVNRAWMHTLGYEEDDVLGRPVSEFVHPDSRARAERLMQKALSGQSVSGFQVEFVGADGRSVLCSGSANCRFENGDPVAIRSIFRDVTEQRRAEREVAASRANLEALVESTGDIIWSVDERHRLITFNTSFALSMEARTGREPRRGDAPPEVFRDEEAGWYREQYERALSGERVSVLRREELEGQTRHFEYFFNPIVDARGICGVVAFGRDVTRRIHAEEALRLAKDEAEAANRAKSQFLANMSHELRTPLNSVIGFTRILLKKDDGGLSDQQRTFLERVHANGRHLLTLINEVLDLAKIESGRMELEIESVDLEELVDETLAQLEGQAKAKKGDRVQLRPDVPEGLAPVETDRAKLKQVIINLVGNALKFTEEGEVSVVVEAGSDGERARAIHVRDTGIGIPDERLEAIFEAFQQADASTSRKYGGTGLGLTISRSICEMLGYGMDVDSEVGAGSTFTIRLSDAPAAKAMRRSDPDAGEGERGRALVIEPDDGARRGIARRLRALGWSVVAAESVEAGLEEADGGSLDAAFVEAALPGPGGWEAVRMLRTQEELADVPLVLVSMAGVAGDTAPEDALRGSVLGPVEVVGLPPGEDELRRAVRRCLGGRSSGRILVVEGDEERRRTLREALESGGHEVALATSGPEALRMLEEARPDVIVLELLMPVMDGVTFLDRLRRMPGHRATPAIVSVVAEPEARERAYLRRQAQSVRSGADGFEERLESLVSQLETPRPARDDDARSPEGRG